MMTAAERLRALRLRTGMSRQAFARAIGYRSASGYYRYEDDYLYGGSHLPSGLVDRLSVVIGLGTPPIMPDDVAQLRGQMPEDVKAQDGIVAMRATHAQIGAALAAGRLDEAMGHCHLLLGAIALLRARA